MEQEQREKIDKLKIVNNESQLSFEEAKRLSIKKWELFTTVSNIKHQFDLEYTVDRDKELTDLNYNCGFCERHKGDDEDFLCDCNNCELGVLIGTCNISPGNLWYKWHKTEDHKEKSKYAKQILEAINSL